MYGKASVDPGGAKVEGQGDVFTEVTYRKPPAVVRERQDSLARCPRETPAVGKSDEINTLAGTKKTAEVDASLKLINELIKDALDLGGSHETVDSSLAQTGEHTWCGDGKKQPRRQLGP